MQLARKPRTIAAIAAGALALSGIACGAVCALCPQQAQAKASTQELRINMPNGVKYATTTFKVDLNHDGKKDPVVVKPIMKGTASGSHGIKVYVKGNKALTLEAKTGSARFSVYYVHMSNKLEFLAIASPRGKKDAFTPGKLVLYKYSKKKLASVADLSQKWGSIGTPSHSAVRSAGKLGITVVASFDKSPLGARSFPLSYTYDSVTKTFALTTTSAKPVVAPRHWTASVKKTLRKVPAGKTYEVVSTTTYFPVDEQGHLTDEVTQTVTKKATNKKVATMKKKAKVTDVRIHKNGYVRVTLGNGKTGWFKWGSYKKGKPFKEVGAGY